MEEELNFISVTDYIGEINGGVAVLLSLNYEDKIYEFAYWFNEAGKYRVVPDQKFLDLIVVGGECTSDAAGFQWGA